MFGAPFMPQTPETYVRLFQQRLRESRPTLWLLNTGWFKGYRDGERFPMAVTRRLLELIESGSLASEAFYKHQVFDFEVPIKAEGLNSEFLRAPEGPQVLELAKAFWANEKKFSSTKAINILNNGGPRRREQTPLSRPRENRNAVFPMLGNPVVDDFK
jgi:phosphoenolpyruvate carboxykinase (ATP)